eukprot:CAMPEP_0194150484 /NCGR_PEP_ID=MMETSP0152-20130528/43552_1 /TAXON_ID=1049557 /ORGANISM="Thalassiothrix antarctica, Strain L6-D1" /LENGTH=479 /DNA_ID=CAMNT_0038853481 /DNA_START=399 /DNA_END=1835 /DNA_ORIENTATION=+
MKSIDASEWNECNNNTNSPFLDHSWLLCLEESGCVNPETGWAPQHVRITNKGTNEVVGYVPMYIKGHSMGEFIFDNSWAEAACQSGITYYPKLLVAVPFTPVAGDKILLKKALQNGSMDCSTKKEIRRAVANFLIEIAESNHLSSVHFNFCSNEEAADLTGIIINSNNNNIEVESDVTTNEGVSTGSKKLLTSQVQQVLERLSPSSSSSTMQILNDYMRRTSLQYHWTNVNPNAFGNNNETTNKFKSFEDYLSCFKSKRRTTIRRERRRVLEEESIYIHILRGTEILQIPGLVERMYEIYVSTVKRMVWGRQYLTLEFFQLLVQSDFCQYICFFCATKQQQTTTTNNQLLQADEVFAGTFNIVKDNVFYGRYWGCLPGQEVKNLHFETCYWSAIEYCIKQGIHRIEPGAGGGDYKWSRGFDPTLMHSTHYICHPGLRRAVREFLEYETNNNIELTEYLRAKSAVSSSSNSNNNNIDDET